MAKILRLVTSEFEIGAKRSFSYFQNVLHLGVIGLLVALPIATVTEQYVSRFVFDTYPLRLVMLAVSLPCLLISEFPEKLKNNFHFYWVAGVTYVLPFSFGVILIQTVARSSTAANSNDFFVIQYLVAVFLYVQVIHSAAIAIALWAVSICAAFATLYLVESPNWELIGEYVVQPVPIFLTAIIIGSLTNRNVHISLREKQNAAESLVSTIAHELRTPLASIHMLAQALRVNLPTLIDSYRRHQSSTNPDQISEQRLTSLDAAFRDILHEAHSANTAIDAMLLNTREYLSHPGTKEILNATEVIQSAVARYPFSNSNEPKMLTQELADEFQILGNPQLVTHVVFNLLRNSLYFGQHSEKKTRVIISTSICTDGNRILVYDNGRGIPRHELRHIFDRFYTTKEIGQGTGIGLSFCKMVMEGIGGKIECHSKEGEYTEFILTFPKVDPDEDLPSPPKDSLPKQTPAAPEPTR